MPKRQLLNIFSAWKKTFVFKNNKKEGFSLLLKKILGFKTTFANSYYFYIMLDFI